MRSSEQVMASYGFETLLHLLDLSNCLGELSNVFMNSSSKKPADFCRGFPVGVVGLGEVR